MTKVLAVVDTNVLVSALISRNPDSSTRLVMKAVFDGQIKPLFNQEILDEYEEVLCRPKFHIEEKQIRFFVDFIRNYGQCVDAEPSGIELIDPDDLVFYEVAMSVEDAKLVTGNQKHFPKQPNIVTPAEMIEILGEM